MARSAKSQQHGREPGPFAGLTFAVYARVSRDDDRAEEHTSPARQISQAKAYVEARGGHVEPAHIYSDERVSGAEFRDCQGLLRLLGALDAGRPSFDALVMIEESRLGREQVGTPYILNRILDAGVRVFYDMADQERRLDSATNLVSK